MTTLPVRDEAAYDALRRWLAQHAASGADLIADSRDVKPGDVFLALSGTRSNAIAYVDEALARGAVAVVSESPPNAAALAVPLRHEPDLRSLAARLAADHYGDPSAELAVAAVTGTNGKTSTTHWIAQILDACGKPSAVLGTLGFAFGAQRHLDTSVLTTPDVVSMQRLCRLARRQGAQALALEASSIGIEQGRLEAMHIEVAVFSNLTQDHLDYHGSFERYAQAKRALFDWPGLESAVLNLDDPYGSVWARELTAPTGPAGLRVLGYRIADGKTMPPATVSGLRELIAFNLNATPRGTRFQLADRSAGATQTSAAVEIPLLGRFNVANVLAALGACVSLGTSLDQALQVLPALKAPPGRMEAVAIDVVDASGAPDEQDLPLVVVDYAHTPDAIAQAVSTLVPIARARGGRLWIVFGAGGDRDASKRPSMGEAARGADRIVVTSDNPRGEDPGKIIAQICAGLADRADALREPDRGRAIETAVSQAHKADLILIAGKGHESTQDIGGVRHAFSDVAQARTALEARARGRRA